MCQPHCTCVSHCTSIVVYLWTSHFCKHPLKINKLQHTLTKLLQNMCQQEICPSNTTWMSHLQITWCASMWVICQYICHIRSYCDLNCGLKEGPQTDRWMVYDCISWYSPNQVKNQKQQSQPLWLTKERNWRNQLSQVPIFNNEKKNILRSNQCLLPNRKKEIEKFEGY